MEAMATAFGPVRPATAPEPPVFMMPPVAAGTDEQKPADLLSKMTEFMPVVQGFMQALPMFMQMFKGMTAAGGVSETAAASAAAASPTGVVS
jgi:hypothetical protein